MENYLKNKKKWRDHDRAISRSILKQAYLNAQTAHPRFLQDALAVIGSIILSGIIVAGVLLFRGCTLASAEAGSMSRDSRGKIIKIPGNPGEKAILENQRDDSANQEIVRAIFTAEGGYKTKYPFGIRSVKCHGYQECKKICENTVRLNRQRYNHNPCGFKNYLAFLSNRYAPVGAGNDPKGINQYWLKNIKIILVKNRKVKLLDVKNGPREK